MWDSCWIKLGYVGLAFVQPYFNHTAPILGCVDTCIEFPKDHKFVYGSNFPRAA
jgi:hypothetical protein